MSRIKYVSVHENELGERRIKAGKGDREHATMRMPTPENDLDEITRHEWERVGVYDLPEEMPKSHFADWWNDHLRTDDEPQVIDDVLRAMGERGDETEGVEA